MQALVAQAAGAAASPSLARLLALDDDLASFGVPAELLAPLRARNASAPRGPLAGLQETISRALGPDTVVRTISLGELGARTRLEGPPRSLLARLITLVRPERAASLRFLARAECPFSSSAAYVFTGAMRHPSRGVEVPYLVVLYDELQIDEATLAQLVL